MTHVMACIDNSLSSLAVCDYSAWASQRLSAPLTLLHVLDEEKYPASADLSGNIGLGSREHLLEDAGYFRCSACQARSGARSTHAQEGQGADGHSRRSFS